jgi:hypothetical protein
MAEPVKLSADAEPLDEIDHNMAQRASYDELVALMLRTLKRIPPAIVDAAMRDELLPSAELTTASQYLAGSRVAGITKELRNANKRRDARQPCIASRAFPRSVNKYTIRRWCRECEAMEERDEEPHFVCWKEGGTWFVDLPTVDNFLTRRRIG